MFKWVKSIKVAATDKYGPNAKTLLSLRMRLIIDSGSAINDAINIVTIDISKPNTNPIKNSNFISPPPKLSFLNKRSPKHLKR